MTMQRIVLVLAVSAVSTYLGADQAINVIKPDQNKMNLASSNSDLKIAVVDTNQLVLKTQQGTEARNKMEQKELQLRQEVQQEGQKLERISTELNSKRSTLSAEALKAEEGKIIRMRSDYERKAQMNGEELKLFAAQEQESLIKAIVESAKEYAVDNKVDIVVDKSSGSVIYSSSKADCTSDLVKVMDKQYDRAIQLAKNKEKETTQLAAKTTGKKAA